MGTEDLFYLDPLANVHVHQCYTYLSFPLKQELVLMRCL